MRPKESLTNYPIQKNHFDGKTVFKNSLETSSIIDLIIILLIIIVTLE